MGFFPTAYHLFSLAENPYIILFLTKNLTFDERYNVQNYYLQHYL